MTQRPTRRALLALLSGSAAAFSAAPARPSAVKQLPRVGEFARYLDEITETPVVRLTALDHASFLPARENRSISVKGRFLVFSSDRAGALSPFRLDLHTGQVLPLLPTTELDRHSLELDAAGHSLFFLDGKSLRQLNLANRKAQTVAGNVSYFSLDTSSQDLILIRDGKLLRADGEDAGAGEEAVWCQVRPGGGGCLFGRRAGETGVDLWFTKYGSNPKPVHLAQGPLAQPCWAPDGHSVLFLREGVICEVALESGEEHRIGGVSRFVAFSANADSSVFVGAVRSRAQPTINLLLRNPPREFTLCEHKASHPDDCAPVFSADSRRVYFNSDFQGKPAIYSVNVEALIEETSG